MDKKPPLISIIVPCYNQAEFLYDALQSVLCQTYANWECIIVDDGSPDNTEAVAQKWLEKDRRFKYIKKENGGLSSARNTGIETASGKFILPLDADDKIGKNYIELAIEVFLNDKSMKIVYCKAEKFGIDTGIWNLEPFSLNSLVRMNMIFCSAIFKKKDWKLVGGYDTNMIYGLEDWEFWIAILKDGGSVKCLDIVGFYYRVKKNSMVKSIGEKEIDFSRKYIVIKHVDFVLKRFEDLSKKNNGLVAKLTSKKHLINLVVKIFFGFTLFKIKD